MCGSGQGSTTQERRVRACIALAALFGFALSPPCAATRPVRVYEVDIAGQSAQAVQDAMRAALVRATGRREAAQDPALNSIVADAPHYVKSYATGPRGEPQVVFDGAAIEQAVTAAGRTVWERERPFTLVVLDPPRARAAAEAARAELERVAAERGLPISLIPLALTDSAGNALGPDALLQAAQRYGADEILIGRGPEGSADLQWGLYTHAQSASWSGPLGAGVDHAVDLLVPKQATSLAEAEAEARVQIEGVDSLAAYAAVERLLESVPGVRHASIAAAEPGSVTFVVSVRGGSQGLEEALNGAAHLVRGSGTKLLYRYQPQG